MNNIYKVIWSKAKNCYVVASEIARSHTKSASGSEKIGGVARHALLALGAACAIACGGFVNVGAADNEVDVNTTGGSTATVYTKEGVDQALTHFDTKTEVDNKINAKIEALTTTGDVATNKANITELQRKTQKIDYDAANETTSINSMKVGQQVDMGGKNLTNVGTINGIALGEKESGDFISQDGSIWGNMKNVDTQVGKNFVAIAENKAAITALDTRVGTVGTGDYLDPTKSVGENLGRLDAGLKQEVADRTAADTALSDRIGTVADDGNYIKKSATNNVSENLKVLDGELAKTNDRTGGITRNADDTQTTIEGKVTVDKDGNVGGVKDLTVDGKLNVGEIYLENNKLESTGKKHDSATSITADGISNLAKVTEHGNTTESQFTHNEKGTFNHAKDGNTTDWKESTSNVTADGVENIAKDSKDNNNTFTQTSTDTKNTLTDKEGNTSSTRQDSKGIYGYAKDKDGNKSYTKQEGNRIAESVIGQDGKETKSEMTSTDITNTAKDGTITNDAKDIVNNATGNMTNTVGGDLTTTVGGNELHEVTGTKIENVTGKVTENYGNGQATNVTGDQDITVSGTQTTTATDINRNASSSMVDKVDNAYGTNTETKEAGKTTTDVSIKGTGEKGKYIRGANESSDYLIKDTLMNSETKTAEATSTEITDGTNKASTIQDAKNLAGSVTNGTETGVSGIHANDDGSVSIDSAVAGGGMSSVINQKKDSIQSAVGDGTNSTVIHQDKDNVTIASSNGMVGLVGKDIVNNAQDTITNTAGTSITNQVNDSKVTTDANGTTFENNTPAVSDDGATTTKINGNQITTGRVNANELAVSDKDGDNTADLSVKAGEDGGVKASAGNGTTTGSLDVKADKVTTSIKSGSKENTVTSTADGTIFNNSKANTAFEGGTYTDTTIKGNTITTGEVTMDYAKVMRDLGVNGNANIEGKTTTGSLEVKGESKLTGKVTMESDATVGGTLDVTGKATFHDDVDITKNLSVDGNATIKGDVTAKSYKVGGNTYIDANGIHANNQKITNVADGSISEGSKDAVNGGQLYGVKRDLEHQVDKVGANAAAMANLRPMEFDPSSKWNIAAAIGNYGSETAAAIGAFYRPNDNVMVNLSTAFGTGENMVGGGVSVRLGKGGNKLSREETNALKAQVADLTARMDALLSVLNPNMSKDFPDVPENHWAYEAVSRLAGNDIVQGYPDGEFHGERTMTRYEMAEIIYNALSRGAEAERKLVEEFKPELQAMAASEKSTAEKAEG